MHRSLIGTEMKISVSKSLDQADVESFVFDGGVQNLVFSSTKSKNNSNLYFAATGHGCASVEVGEEFETYESRLMNYMVSVDMTEEQTGDDTFIYLFMCIRRRDTR